MACHEIAALRLGMMKILGNFDSSLAQHELMELGVAADQPGPLKNLSQSTDLKSLKQSVELCRADLEDRVSKMAKNDPQLGYTQTLSVLNKKIESDLDNLMQYCERFFEDLEQVHDHMHVIYPADED